jgi:hypothetical protein
MSWAGFVCMGKDENACILARKHGERDHFGKLGWDRDIILK